MGAGKHGGGKSSARSSLARHSSPVAAGGAATLAKHELHTDLLPRDEGRSASMHNGSSSRGEPSKAASADAEERPLGSGGQGAFGGGSSPVQDPGLTLGLNPGQAGPAAVRSRPTMENTAVRVSPSPSMAPSPSPASSGRQTVVEGAAAASPPLTQPAGEASAAEDGAQSGGDGGSGAPMGAPPITAVETAAEVNDEVISI